MPIVGIKQPDFIKVDEDIRLRKYNGTFDFASIWYQDVDTVYLVDGIKEAYSESKIKNMYEYLNNHVEVYFIEILKENSYLPIGDVTFWQDDMPIVIGDKNYRGKKIGEKVVYTLIQRGIKLGYTTLKVDEIYDYNIGSRKCFEKNGFVAYEKTEKGNRFKIDL